MAVTVVIFLPMGALSLRLVHFNGLVWLHATFQLLSLCLLFAGFGLGIHLGQLKNEVGLFNSENHKTPPALALSFCRRFPCCFSRE